MRILLLCNRDLASLYALNLLLPRIDGHSLVIGQSSRVGAAQPRAPQLQELAAFERRQLGHQEADYLRSCARNQGREIPWAGSFNDIQRIGGFEILPLDAINEPSGLALLDEIGPELILSIRFGKILQQSVIDMPRFGVINLHSGNLPAYQGVMATFWAMLNGDQSIGSCLHYISDKRIDAGKIIQQRSSPVDARLSYLEHALSLYPDGVEMMAAAVERLERGHALEARSQQGTARYYGFPESEDLQRFSAQGFSLF